MTTKFLSKEAALRGRKWHVVDATDVPLGRLASEVATLIRGKHRPDYTPHVDGGDFVIVINASKVRLTGKKRETKTYYWHSNFMGGLKSKSAGKMLDQHPDRVIKSAVKGMLLRGALGHNLINKLKVYAGPEHPHKAQLPEPYQVKYARAAS